MNIELNDLIDLGDGINRLIISHVHFNNEEYILLIDEDENQKLLKLGEEGFIELDMNNIPVILFKKLISMMNLNLDFNFDYQGTLKF